MMLPMNTSKFKSIIVTNLPMFYYFVLQMCLFYLYQMWPQSESIRRKTVRETRYQDANGLTLDPFFLQIQLSLPPLKSHSFDNPDGKYWIKNHVSLLCYNLATIYGLSVAFPIKTIRSSEF